MTLLLERTAEPEALEAEEERLVDAVLREVLLPVLRLVVAAEELPVDRLVRVFWSTVPAERAVEEPVLRLVVAAEELLVDRLVRVF